mgnify:CR=1 FL=1
MRKRIYSMILCLGIILSSIGGCFSYAAESANGQSEETSKEMFLLSYLGIIEVTEDESKVKTVTRGDFSEYICKAFKIGEVTDKVYFIDVQSDCWAAKYINALYESGIVSPAADKMFNPNDNITYEQACKMLVYALGYGKWVNYNGGSMTVFTEIAQRGKFGISPADVNNLSVEECATLLYKAMKVDLPEFTGERTKSGDTIFETYHDIYIREGQVRTVGGLSLDNNSLDDGKAQVDNETFDVDSGCDIGDFFGQRVEYIYKKADDTKTIIYTERISEDDKVVIKSGDIKSVDEKSGAIEYYTDNGSKVKKLNFDPKSNVFINGRAMETHLNDRIQEFIDETRKGTVELIKANGASVYNIVNIKSYEVFIIGSYDEKSDIIYDYYNSENKIGFSDTEHLNIIDTNGMKANMPKTFPATVLIAKADNSESIEIICCNEKKEVKVSSTNTNERKIFSDGTEYKIDKTTYDRLSSGINVGKTYSVTLDNFGEIVYITQKLDGTLKLGWLKKGYLIDKGFAEYSLCLDIYDHTEGKAHKLYMADSITIDAEKYKAEKYRSVVSALPGTNELDESSQYVRIEPQIIRYSVNDNNDIINIDTINCGTNEDKDNSLTEVGSGEKYFSASNSWLGIDMIWQNGYTKMFMVPEVSADGYIYINGDRRDDDDNMYSNSLILSDWRRYNVVGYKWSEESWNCEAIVVKQASTKEYGYHLLFDSIYTEIDGNGEIKDVLKCQQEGATKTFYIDSTMKEKANALKQGDIFTIDTEYSGKTAITITKMFDAESKTFEPYSSYTNPNRYWYRENPPTESTVGGLGGWRVDHAQLAKGYAKTIKGSMLSISYTLSDARDGKSTMPKGGVPVTIYEKDSPKQEKIYSGSINDIKTYDVFGEDCSLVIYCAYSGRVREIIVYK